MSLLVLDMYGMLVERLKGKVKPNLRTIVTALLKHASQNKENPGVFLPPPPPSLYDISEFRKERLVWILTLLS
jgi:hypothetical protein